MLDYTSRQWKKKRLKILKRDGYLCQYYKRYGKRMEATTVHHIYPASEYPEYTWCEWNMISLSTEAHEMMHDRKTRKLTKLGEALKQKTIPPPSTDE